MPAASGSATVTLRTSRSTPDARKSSTGVGALAAGARGADLRVEDEQRRLQVAARALHAGRGAQVAAERRLLADLEVGDAPCAGAERLDRLLELGERRAGADDGAVALAADARESGAPDEDDPAARRAGRT